MASKIRWRDHGSTETISELMTYEGTTTETYFTYLGAKRRLVVNHTIDRWGNYGVWQADCECTIVRVSGQLSPAKA